MIATHDYKKNPESPVGNELHLNEGAKTINIFRACIGAQLTICAQK